MQFDRLRLQCELNGLVLDEGYFVTGTNKTENIRMLCTGNVDTYDTITSNQTDKTASKMQPDDALKREQKWDQ